MTRLLFGRVATCMWLQGCHYGVCLIVGKDEQEYPTTVKYSVLNQSCFYSHTYLMVLISLCLLLLLQFSHKSEHFTPLLFIDPFVDKDCSKSWAVFLSMTPISLSHNYASLTTNISYNLWKMFSFRTNNIFIKMIIKGVVDERWAASQCETI